MYDARSAGGERAAADRLLMVASDRISTYDAVHPTPIPDKGKVLTGLSVFWFEQTAPHRRQPPDLGDRRRAGRGARARAGRAQAARCCRSSASCAATSPARAGRTTRRPARSRGIELPAGLRESEQLPEPIFTPGTKADVGHDETIDFERAVELRRRPRADASACATSRSRSTRSRAEHARERGVILADTKFEFGLDAGRRARRSATRC